MMGLTQAHLIRSFSGKYRLLECEGQTCPSDQLDHLKDAVFKNMTMTDWNQKQDGFWHIDHAKNVQFINVAPPHANIE
ncbi:hypothetical protein P4S72_05910 [Vibrio sp. PP-XX7]